MSGRRKGVALFPPAVEASALTLRQVAERAGVPVGKLEELARQSFLEPTYSVDEIATHLGCGKWQVQQLVLLGLRHGQALHPTRGGLYPTFKPSHKSRRIPLSAVERHKRHMARVHDGIAV